MPLTAIRRTTLAVITAIALLATTSGQALAGGPDGLYLPADIDSMVDQGGYHLELLAPWEHTVVVVHVTEGALADGDDEVDISQIVGSAEDYVNGRAGQALVDVVITQHYADSAAYWAPHGFFGPEDGPGPILPPGINADNSGAIAQGLYRAGQFCQMSWVAVCDVLLVTYQAPEDPHHRRQAMAEAMLLNQTGRLHTIAVEDGLNDPDHVEFSSLLGALGTHAQVADQRDFVFFVDHMLQPTIPVYVNDPCRGSDWPDWVDCPEWEYEEEEPCEIYDPDGNCYYGEDIPTPDTDICLDYEGELDCDTGGTASEEAGIWGLHWELSDYLDTQICAYPGLDGFIVELDELSQWLLESLLDYVRTNYPDLDLEAEADELSYFVPTSSDFLVEFCSDDGENHVAIGFVGSYVDQTNWISLVAAEGNAEIVELRYIASSYDLGCDELLHEHALETSASEIAPELSIQVDSTNIGLYYCLRVEFADSDVQFLQHQLGAEDLVDFDEPEPSAPPTEPTARVSDI